MARVIALMALAALGLTEARVHEPVHDHHSERLMSTTERYHAPREIRRSGVRHERGRPRLLPLITWSSACAFRGGTGSRSKLGVPAVTRLSGSCGGRRARLGFHPLGGLGP